LIYIGFLHEALIGRRGVDVEKVQAQTFVLFFCIRTDKAQAFFVDL